MSKIALLALAVALMVGIVATTLILRPTKPLVIARTAKTQAHIAPDQTLVAGGWIVDDGNQLLVFIKPQIVDAQTVALTTVYIEAPPALWKSIIDAKLPQATTNRNVTQQLLLSDKTYDTLLKTAERQYGVQIMSAPKAVVSSGNPAIVSVAGPLDAARTNNLEFGKLDWAGIMTKLHPKISSDGTHLDLEVQVQVNLLTGNITRRMTWLDRLAHAFRR